jgi:glycerol uptake facilitator-like aquaporin
MTSAEPPVEHRPLSQRIAAEALGTAALLAAVVGSGIMAERLAHDVALALLCNTMATAAMLFVLIVIFAPVSAAHFNPAVTLVAFVGRAIPARTALLYVLAQIAGAILGVWLAHAMFGETLFAWGVKERSGFGQWLSEGVATFGLILTVAGCRERSRETVASAVALYIASAYWFTSSTSFANPAVTLARSLTPSFAGIRPVDAPAFIAAQIIGALLAAIVARLLFPAPASPTP